jgi:hypothetical protein
MLKENTKKNESFKTLVENIVKNEVKKQTLLKEEITIQDIISQKVKLPTGYKNSGFTFEKTNEFGDNVNIIPNIKGEGIDGYNITIRINTITKYLTNGTVYKKDLYKGDFNKMFKYIDDILDEWIEIRNEFEDFKNKITTKVNKFNSKYKMTD